MKKIFGILLAILTWMPAIAQSEAEIDSWFNKGSEEFTQGNYIEAIKWWRKAAEQGYAKAQTLLGSCYHNGQGVEKSYTEAAKWLRKAAEQGLAESQYMLGSCYYKGRGIEKSYTEAAKWCSKAAEQG